MIGSNIEVSWVYKLEMRLILNVYVLKAENLIEFISYQINYLFVK